MRPAVGTGQGSYGHLADLVFEQCTAGAGADLAIIVDGSGTNRADWQVHRLALLQAAGPGAIARASSFPSWPAYSPDHSRAA